MPFEPTVTPEDQPQDRLPRGTGARRRLPDLLGLLRRRPVRDLDRLMPRIQVASLPITDEELACNTHREHGQRLARQDRWEDLARLIDYADATRLHTPAGDPATLLLADGARADLVAATRDAILDGADPDPAGVDALEDILSDHPQDYACALVVALAHIDIGRAWRRTPPQPTPHAPELRFLDHFRRAEDLLAPFDAVALDAPSVASAQCALLLARPQPHLRVAEDHARLIDLDPDCPRHMRALGTALLPAQHGDYDRLESEARNTALRTEDIWGAGGYVWVYLDALAQDAAAMTRFDAAFFVQGLRDIVARKHDQHVINQLSAFCGIVMAERTGKTRLAAPIEAKRQRVHDCLEWLLENHLQELHPVIWSQTLLCPGAASDAAPGLYPSLPSRRALLERGRQTALRIIAQCFAEDIEDGGLIAFSPSGMYRLPGN